jgi:hypothetical protein
MSEELTKVVTIQMKSQHFFKHQVMFYERFETILKDCRWCDISCRCHNDSLEGEDRNNFKIVLMFRSCGYNECLINSLIVSLRCNVLSLFAHEFYQEEIHFDWDAEKIL